MILFTIQQISYPIRCILSLDHSHDECTFIISRSCKLKEHTEFIHQGGGLIVKNMKALRMNTEAMHESDNYNCELCDLFTVCKYTEGI